MIHIDSLRRLTSILTLALPLALVALAFTPVRVFAQGGPVLVLGIDAEDGGPNGHGPLTAYRAIVDAMLSNTTNSAPTDVLVVGVKGSGPLLAFYSALLNQPPARSRTFVAGGAISAVPFNNYKLIIVVTSGQHVPGGLDPTENVILNQRKNDIRAFINCGGGLLAFSGPMNTATFPQWYNYLDLPGLGPITYQDGGTFNNVVMDNAGAAGLGITVPMNQLLASSGDLWHTMFPSFPTALPSVAHRTSTNLSVGFGSPLAYANTLPLVSAGTSQTIECTSHSGMSVTLDGSASDADGDPLTYRWFQGNTQIGTTAGMTVGGLMLGTHTFTLKVSDGQCGGESQASVTFTIVDTQPPVISGVGPDASVECPADPYSQFSSPSVSDACDPNPVFGYTDVVTPGCGGTSSVTRTWTATDASNNSASASQTITVEDNSAPVIATNAAVKLWPPNHEYVSFDIDDMVASVSDACGTALTAADVTIHSVWSDEVEDDPDLGDGETLADIVISCDFQSVMLRKERMGNSNGRVYTVKLQLSDGCNTGYATFTVGVPKNANGKAVDDGAIAGYTVDACSMPKDIAGPDAVAARMTLEQNYPNPFNPTTTIRFTLPAASDVTLTVFDMHGRAVAVVAEGRLDAGAHTRSFDASHLASGQYLYRLEGGGVTLSRVMQLVK